MAERTNPHANLIIGAQDEASPVFDKIKASSQSMAAGVEQAATKAAGAVGGIGDKAAPAAQKLDGITASMIRQVQRLNAELEAGGARNAAYIEKMASVRGADLSALAPYLEDLKKAEAAQRVATTGLNHMGMSAKQTSAALRQVPMQFTDIVVSLQGGQSAMQVLLQQGGQLKDMFGGIGPAVRAMGGYVVGLINPFTMAAAAAGALAYAYNQGSKEADAYNKALITTGNAAGTNAAQLKSYAQEISSVVGTQGKAAEALSALAATGNVGAESLKEAAQAAVQYERATGQAVSKTAEQFASLRNEPLAAVLKLNDGMNFLTESTYRQIKSLEEQGKTAEAANVAQRAFADTLSGRSGEMERNLGTVERGWIAVKDAAKSAWDAILNVGRASTSVDQLAEVRKQIAARENQLANDGFGSNGGGAAFGRPSSANSARLSAELTALKAQAAALEGVAFASKTAAEAERQRGESVKASAAFDKAGERFLTDKVKMERDLADARVQGAEAGKTQAEIEKRLAEIRESYSKKGAAAAKAEQSAYATLIASVRAKIAQNEMEIATGGKLNEAEKLRLKLTAELEAGSRKLSAARRAEAEAELKRLDASERALAVFQAQKKFEAERDKETASIADQISKINGKAQSLEDEAAAYGKTADELRALTVDRLNEQKAVLMGFDGSEQRIDMLNQEIEAVQRLGKAETTIADRKLGANVDEVVRAAQAQADAYQEEWRFAGMTAVERAKIVAERKIELDYAKRIADVDKSGASDEAKARARDNLRAAERQDKEVAGAKAVADEWQRTADSINQSLTDALLRGFEDGKGFGKNFADTLKNMFKTLVLRPVISFIVQPIGNLIQGAIGGLLGGGQGGAGNLMGTASNLNSAWGMLNGTGTGLSGIGYNMLAGLPGSVGYGMLPGMTVGSQQAAMLAAQTQGFGGAGLQATAGAAQTAQGASWMTSSSAAGLAAVAAPLIIGSLIESNSRDRISGAAYATSGGNDPLTQTVAGSTRFDYLTGDLPDRAALLARLEELGAPMQMIGDWNDRALLYLAESAEGDNSEYGINWTPRIRNMSDTPDFYRGAGYAHPEDLGWWNNKDNANLSTDPALIQASRDIALSIIGPLEGIGALIGDEAAYRATVGFANRGKGNGVWAGMNLTRGDETIADWVNMDDFHSVGEAVRAMYSTALGTLDSFDLPGWADRQVTDARAALDALEGENMGQEAAALYAQTTAGIEQMYRSIQMLIDVFPDFTNATQDSVHALAELMGGMDNLQSAYSTYIGAFWSEGERQALMTAQLTAQLAELGQTMPTTAEGFRRMVEDALAAGESGNALAAALLGMSGAMAQVLVQTEAVTFGAAQDLAGAIQAGLLGTFDGENLGAFMAQTVSDGIYNAIASGFAAQITDIIVQGVINPVIQAALTGSSVSAAVSAASIESMVAQAQAVTQAAATILNDPAIRDAIGSISSAVASISVPAMPAAPRYVQDYGQAVRDSGSEAERAADRIRDASDSWRTLLGEVEAIFDMTRDAVRDLRGEVDSTRAASAASANAFIADALITLRSTGALPDADGLRTAIDDARAGLRVQDYVSVAEFERDQLILAAQMDEINSAAGQQKSFAEQQIDLLDAGNAIEREQLDALRRLMQAGGITPPAGGAPPPTGGGLLLVSGLGGSASESPRPAPLPMIRYPSLPRAMMAGGDSGIAAETTALREEVKRLNEQVQQLVELARSSNNMLDQVSGGGQSVRVTGQVKVAA